MCVLVVWFFGCVIGRVFDCAMSVYGWLYVLFVCLLFMRMRVCAVVLAVSVCCV